MSDEPQPDEPQPNEGRARCMCGAVQLVAFTGEKWPGETHVPLACFDTPVDRQPSGHAFVAEHAPWITPQSPD